MKRCECCGQEYEVLFPGLSRDSAPPSRVEICSDCSDLVNEEYHCGIFRSFAVLESAVDGRYVGSLVA